MATPLPSADAHADPSSRDRLMQAAVEIFGRKGYAAASVRETAEQQGVPLPLVLAVTVLTSMDDLSLRRDLKINRSLRREVAHLAELAQRAGMSGVVASPQEIRLLRKAVRGAFVILTPGVRPAWAGKDDQKRVMTPGEAVACGADYIVIGRPVLKASDRRAAVEKIVREIGQPSV